jgi:hypothetical protein
VPDGRSLIAVAPLGDELPGVLGGGVPTIAIVVMFGMYLWATRGIKKYEKTTTHKPDGTFVEKEKIEYINPASALGAIVNIFRHTK